ncbi:uncharacterized protein LOC131478809 [Ochotona princeps]|uniref:uncharacterized protein LOC131478809 n=1 Tax=Ochotona princeps TaxID=9978 RepID=UPI002714EC2A|nr:uncharacterized protein LOC131478809 [Ochotona princeps]
MQIHRIVGFEIVPYSVVQMARADGSLSCYQSNSSSSDLSPASLDTSADSSVPAGKRKNAINSPPTVNEGRGGFPYYISPSLATRFLGARRDAVDVGAGGFDSFNDSKSREKEGSNGSSSSSGRDFGRGRNSSNSNSSTSSSGNGNSKSSNSSSGPTDNEGISYLHDLIRDQLRVDGATRDIAFTYDVLWQKSSTPWSQRWDAYLKNARDSPIIHWFSIVNSLVVVLLLSGIVAMIMLRVLYRDIAKYNELLVDEDEAEETGWKLLHGDVFRKPPHSTVLAALAGSGMQLIGMAFVTVVFAGLGVVSPAYRGSLLQTMLLLWTVMGAAAGYTSARLYKMFKSTHWKMTTIRTALMFPGVVFAIFFLLNLVLWIQKSSAAVSFSALLTLLMLWFGISTPPCFQGAYIGFRQPPISLPVRINKIPRQIPQQPWFMQPVLCCLVGGALPFGYVSFSELFFLFSSIWQHRFYYLFGFLFLVLVILCVTCAEISITFVYFQLVCEDYLWWWRSFLCSASSGVYVLLYAVYYFHSRLKLTHATGALIYFGYSLIIAYACFILTGAIGFLASFFFLRKIYGSIKVD